MIKAVIFDLDGTLLNRDASVENFITDQYERLKNYLGHIPKSIYTSRFIELDNRGYVWKDKVYRQLVEENNIQLSPAFLLDDYVKQFKNHVVPFPNLVETLDELGKMSLRLGMITNGQGQFQLDNIKSLGIKDYFDSILISEWEGLKKPDPAIFQKSLHQLGVRSNECMFVGDHPENDIQAAKKVGMKTVWKQDDHYNAPVTDYTVADLIELPAIIANEN